ncbi:nicotinate phosphoribosyltransferase [Ornithinimicrobium sp. Arc0846-15]|nr:nicotinate phosphoribosyltransferase [Ornithinimicrobium laminariae]
MTSTALLTDHYELTMLQASLASGHAHRKCVFESFARGLPGGRRYGVLAGTGRVLEALKDFRFGDDELSFLSRTKVVNGETLDYLANYRFSGNISGYAEGECYFPGSPLMVVESTFAEGVILETLVLSILNYDSAVATAASRMTATADGRPCLEMGSRRTNEQSAVAAARAAYIAGFEATSNLEAGRSHGVPTVGTAAHSFTLLHDTEEEAFASQIASLGANTALLVDTYDVTNAVKIAVDLAGSELGGVRLDSGDLVSQAREVRAQLDSLGAKDTRIVVTSDLDEYAIAGLQAAPVDAYGVGTRVVTGSGSPAAGMVFKLVSRESQSGEMEGVAKASKNKASVGGRKYALRRRNAVGVAQEELIGIQREPQDDGDDRLLLTELVRDGEVVAATDAQSARAHHQKSRAELPTRALRLSAGDPAIPTTYLDDWS